jgi:hypothetical protein
MRFPRYPKNNQTGATRRQIKSKKLPKSAQKKTKTNKQNKQETRRKPKSPRRPLTTQKMLRNWNSFQILTITDKRADQILRKKPTWCQEQKIHLASSSWLSSSSSSWTPFGALLWVSTEDPFSRKFLLSVRWHSEIVFLKSPFGGGYFLVYLMCCNVRLPHYHTTYKLSSRINLDFCFVHVFCVSGHTISCCLHNLPLKFSFAHIRTMWTFWSMCYNIMVPRPHNLFYVPVSLV